MEWAGVTKVFFFFLEGVSWAQKQALRNEQELSRCRSCKEGREKGAGSNGREAAGWGVRYAEGEPTPAHQEDWGPDHMEGLNNPSGDRSAHEGAELAR